MAQLATPHLAINRKFLKAIGLWPHQSGISKHLLFVNMLCFTVSQCYFQTGGMIAAWKYDINVFMESIPPVLVSFICGAKLVNFVANSEKMATLLFTLEADWKRFKGRGEIDIMKGFASFGRKFTLAFGACMLGSMAPFLIVPAVPIVMEILRIGNVTEDKQLIFRYEYLVDAKKYYYFFLLHSYCGTLMYIVLVVAIDSILMIYVQHACGAFAVLGYQLEHLTDGIDIEVNVYPPKKNDISHDDMSACLAQHNHALQYSKLIEDANYMSYFFQLGITMVCLSFTGFQTVMYIDTPEIAFRYIAFTGTQLLMLFLQSYPGQMLYDHSVIVSEYVVKVVRPQKFSFVLSGLTNSQLSSNDLFSVMEFFSHNSGWYLTSLRTRTLVCVMIMRSRVPCVLTAGKFYILNLANFSAVVRTSISYLTVLTSVK